MDNQQQVNPKMTPESVRRQNLNPSIESDVELQSQLITPQTGRAKVGRDLASMYMIKNNSNASYWDLATAITSDTRLSNLTKVQERYVQWTLKMLGLCLMFELPKSAAMADWLRATVCEPSLGREMALRNNLQTVQTKSEAIQVEESSPKRNFLGIPIGGGK